MTLTYELGLDILKTYLRTKNEVSRSRLSKVRARTGQTHRQTDTHTDRQTHRLTDATKSSTIRFVGGKNETQVASRYETGGTEYWTVTQSL